MNPRPQFSLRMLLLVTTLVCLASAAAAPIPLPPGKPVLGGGVGWSWNDMGFAIHSQALLRAVVCTFFPAAAIAGASARDVVVSITAVDCQHVGTGTIVWWDVRFFAPAVGTRRIDGWRN